MSVLKIKDNQNNWTTVPALNGTNAVGDVRVNGTSVVSNGTANVSVPTNNNQLTNGAGYQTATDVNGAINTALSPITSAESTDAGKALIAYTVSGGVVTDWGFAEMNTSMVVETISDTDVTITGLDNHRYMCGEVTSISITPPASGTIDVVFTSGSTVAVLTIPNTVKLPDWFDPTALDTDTVYEINICDGIYGTVMMWDV